MCRQPLSRLSAPVLLSCALLFFTLAPLKLPLSAVTRFSHRGHAVPPTAKNSGAPCRSPRSSTAEFRYRNAASTLLNAAKFASRRSKFGARSNVKSCPLNPKHRAKIRRIDCIFARGEARFRTQNAPPHPPRAAQKRKKAPPPRRRGRWFRPISHRCGATRSGCILPLLRPSPARRRLGPGSSDRRA
ncbi:hypothetical protein ACVJH7_007525 [Bradyrhizobium elkanii]